MKLVEVLCCLIVMGLSSAFPKSRSRYYPRSYMVGGSYYANPRYAREDIGYEYLPPGRMTAMVVGDTVATNSFSGPAAYSPPHEVLSLPVGDLGQIEEDDISEQVTKKQHPVLISLPESESVNETDPEIIPEQPVEDVETDEQETLSGEDVTTEAAAVFTTKKAKIAVSKATAVARKTKTGKAKKPVVSSTPPTLTEETEDEDSGLIGSWPFAAAGRAGIPSYNAFFPVFIGGGSPSGRSRGRLSEDQEGGYPGSATAIANSFSTGKGGVATSHATSFGDPYAAAMMRNSGLFNFRTKQNRKQQTQEEDEE